MKTMADESTAVSTAVSTATSTAPEAKWYSGFDAESQAYITARGLADKDPAAAFLEAAKAHREAQAYIGVPKEQLLKLPKADAPPEEWDAVYERLGYSKDAEAYKLDTLKRADGTDADDGFKEFVRAQAADLKLSPAAAAKFGEAALRFQEAAAATQTTAQTAEATKAMEALKQSWGPNYEANKVIADNAYAAIMKVAGFDQATMTAAIQKLGETTGKAEVMQMLLAVGQQIGEDKFIGGGGPQGNLGPRNAEQAKIRLNELKADSTWTQRFLQGGAAEVKEFNELSILAQGNA
jgi:hypothetical protein